jgi:hypothetical protein
MEWKAASTSRAAANCDANALRLAPVPNVATRPSAIAKKSTSARTSPGVGRARVQRGVRCGAGLSLDKLRRNSRRKSNRDDMHQSIAGLPLVDDQLPEAGVGSRRHPQALDPPQPSVELVPTRENAAHQFALPSSSHSLDRPLAAARLSREIKNQAAETPTTKTAATTVNCHVRDFTSCSFARALTLLGSSSSARE